MLDDAGVLSLQGLELIPLLGLDEEDIKRRLEAESYLSVFEIDVRILDQEPIGVEALKPFGYDVFEQRETGFEAPLPARFRRLCTGPGDKVRVQLFGNVNDIYETKSRAMASKFAKHRTAHGWRRFIFRFSRRPE